MKLDTGVQLAPRLTFLGGGSPNQESLESSSHLDTGSQFTAAERGTVKGAFLGFRIT